MVLSWLLLSLLTAVQPAGPQRVLLLADDASSSLEQQSVAQVLTAKLMADPSIELLTPEPLPPSLQRADLLRTQAQRSLAQARRALESLEPFVAEREAAYAVMRLERAAMLAGDLGDLPESLGLLAAALLHLDAPTRALHTLVRLLVLDPEWQPDAGHYSPDMLAHITRARRRLKTLPQRQVAIDAGDARAALFVDGKFVNFGKAKVTLAADVTHFLWAQPEQGFAHGQTLMLGRSRAPQEVALALPQAGQIAASHQLRFRPLIEASLNPQGFVNAHSALLSGMRVDEVWVLGYDAGMVRLTAFELRSGRRHQVATPRAHHPPERCARRGGHLVAAAHRGAVFGRARPLRMAALQRR